MDGAAKPGTVCASRARWRSSLAARLPCAARRRGMGGQLGPEYRPSDTSAQVASLPDPRLLRCSALISDCPGRADRARLCRTCGGLRREQSRAHRLLELSLAARHRTAAKPAAGTLAGQSGVGAEQRSGCGSATEGSWADVFEGLYSGPSCPPIPRPRAAQGSLPADRRADRRLRPASVPAAGFAVPNIKRRPHFKLHIEHPLCAASWLSFEVRKQRPPP